MIKKTKKFRLIFLIFALFFFISPKSYADEFNDLNINVNIDKNGVATIGEEWDTNDEEGTEKYKPIENLKGIKIEDFKASLDSKEFTPLDPWDVNKSFEEKANHYGINYTDNGLELCWGITHYGNNKFNISYKINPIIVGLNDYDILYWQFVNSDMSTSPENVEIKISGYENFNDQIKMWGFGLEGNINNQNGSIVLKSNGDVNYATILLRFPKGYFNTSYTENRNFKEYADMALKGSEWDPDTEGVTDDYESSDSGNFPIFIILALVILSFCIIIPISKALKSSSLVAKLDRDNKILPKVKDLKEQYFQETPYKDDIEDIYLFVKKAYTSKISEGDFLNAFILKRIYEGAIENKKGEKDGLFSKDEDKISIIKTPENMGRKEKEFFEILKKSKAYSDDEFISQKNINKYLEKHQQNAEDLMENFDIYSSETLEDKGFIKSVREKKFLYSETNLEPTQNGIELYGNLIKFKNYLEDYSLIKERDANEVKIWDYYMIFAACFGISDKVFKNLREVNPEFETMSVYSYNTILWSRSYSSSITQSYANFMSAGSGGSTSFGGGGFSGGGGSFGGGSGGGSR